MEDMRSSETSLLLKPPYGVTCLKTALLNCRCLLWERRLKVVLRPWRPGCSDGLIACCEIHGEMKWRWAQVFLRHISIFLCQRLFPLTNSALSISGNHDRLLIAMLSSNWHFGAHYLAVCSRSWCYPFALLKVKMSSCARALLTKHYAMRYVWGEWMYRSTLSWIPH
jgi:hypothetical protein